MEFNSGFKGLKAVKSFSQWGAQLLGSVHPHLYEYLHITSNHVIRQAVGIRFVQHDHQKDRIEEQCEMPLKAVKSFSQWGAQLLGSVHSHFYKYCDSTYKKYVTWFSPLKKKTRWLETRMIKHCPGNSHKFWICEAGSIRVLRRAQAVTSWILISEAQIQSHCSPCGTCGWPSGTGAGSSPSTSVSLANFNSQILQSYPSSQVGTVCPFGTKTSIDAVPPNAFYKQRDKTLIKYKWLIAKSEINLLSIDRRGTFHVWGRYWQH